MKSNREQLLDIFIKPLVDIKPSNIPLDKWLELIFCVYERPIEKYKARKNFKIINPRVVETPKYIPHKSICELKIHKNDIIIYREDRRDKTFVDCEIISDKFKYHYWIKMTPEEWLGYKEHMKGRKWKRRRLH